MIPREELSRFATSAQIEKLSDYVQLLKKWNSVYNLTAITDEEDIWIKHILDSLSIKEYIQGETILDVGTGAGLPGIPLAICCSDKKITLLDSQGKKTKFLTQLVYELQLPHVTVVQSRVEKFQGQFDAIVSRAFASVAEFVQVTDHLVKPTGMRYAMKGELMAEELQLLKKPYRQISISVPLLSAKRCLCIV